MTDDAASPTAALQHLRNEIADISAREPSLTSASFTSWRSRSLSALIRALGPEHHITRSMNSLKWTPAPFGETVAGRFRRAAQQARGLLDAAINELELLPDHPDSSTLAYDAAGVDPELWAFINNDVDEEHWGRAATQAMLYVEDRIRRWTGQPPELVSEKLMTAVFGEHGTYKLGLTPGEQQGWHRLAMGMSMALRNAVAHRIQNRDDHRRYTLGVIGVGSLLLTQLRYEHGNRFHDTRPVVAEQLPGRVDDIVDNSAGTA